MNVDDELRSRYESALTKCNKKGKCLGGAVKKKGGGV